MKLLTISISIPLVIPALLAQTSSPKYVGDRFDVVQCAGGSVGLHLMNPLFLRLDFVTGVAFAHHSP
jgi:hypothetical protein